MNKDSPMTEEIQRKSDKQALQKDDHSLTKETKLPAIDTVEDIAHAEIASAKLVRKEKKVMKKEAKAEKKKARSKKKEIKGKAEEDSERGTNRGIETMFRVTFQNHIQMTALADAKANTLININGIIISLVIALVSPRIATNSWMMVPALILTIGCMLSLGYAIFASRPRILSTVINKDMVMKNEAEILFFGNFVNMSSAEFQDTMNELLTRRNLLYDNMTRNLYFMGKVLERKYRLLKYSYTIFFITFAMAVVFFIGMFIGMAGE
ncbi:MAG: hypothetical protein ACI9SC_003071 [Gammaproteobacteria bacterium]|jgi:hypothetical protein